MYDAILHKSLQIPPGKSDAVCDLLHGLLQKDPHRRLGAIADFVSESWSKVRCALHKHSNGLVEIECLLVESFFEIPLAEKVLLNLNGLKKGEFKVLAFWLAGKIHFLKGALNGGSFKTTETVLMVCLSYNTNRHVLSITYINWMSTLRPQHTSEFCSKSLFISPVCL